MHYYTFNIGDYAGHTKGLSLIEDLAYRRLLDEYYMRERPLNGCSTTVARMVGMRDHQAEVDYVLRTFFVLNDNGEWENSRANREIEHYKAKSQKAAMAGKASAERRLNGRSTDAQRMLNNRSTDVQLTNNQQPINNNQEQLEEKEKEKKEKERSRQRASLSCPKPDNVSNEVWEGFSALRKAKKAPITAAALAGIEREAIKARMSLQDALQTCCARGWAGFKAEWVTQNTTQTQYNRRSIHDERADTIRKLTGRYREPASEIIDIWGDPSGLDRAPF